MSCKLVEPNLTSDYLASDYFSGHAVSDSPTARFRVGLRMSRVALAVAFFTGSQFQPAQMFPQSISHQSGTVSLSVLGGLVGGV